VTRSTVAAGLRIGIDARELQGRPTGVGRYLRSLLRHWIASGQDELLLYLNGPAPELSPLQSPRVRLRPVGDRPTRGLVWQEWLLPAAVRADAPDVFFSPAYACPLRLRVPRVTTVHDLSYFACPQDFTWRDALRRRLLVSASLRVSARVVAVSDFTRREVLGLRPELHGRVVLVPQGVDDGLPAAPGREEARRLLGLRGPLVLSVGSIFNRRRLPELLRAIAHLRARRPELVLDVVGDNRTHPPLDPARLARELGIEGLVRLSGYVSEPELALRYAAADAAIFLSDYEGFGLPALEAAVRGVPLIVSTLPALGEVYRDAALLVDPQDVPGIADALERVLGSEPTRKDLIARGSRLAASHAWAETARRTREVLAEAAAP
jgi:glycosyltransferase involved in cell wall biosynthesis